jgi:hypothetical protein
MKISESDDYERLASVFQALEVSRLNSVLQRHGVKSKQMRREIVEEYFFGQGVFLDDGWFGTEKDKRVSPVIAYAKRDRKGAHLELVLPVKPNQFSYHERARRNSARLFDADDENWSEIKHGLFGD